MGVPPKPLSLRERVVLRLPRLFPKTAKRWLTFCAVSALALSTMGASCGKQKPPQLPQPTCPAGMHDEAGTCVPDVAAMPAPGVPIAPERLLRQEGGRLTKGVQLFGAVQCCMTFQPEGTEVNSRWPQASEAWQDYTHSFGANIWHARFGPFIADADHEIEWQDVGGPYLPGTLNWNPPFWVKARELGWHALKLDGYYEVNPEDQWACKFAQAGNSYIPWPAEEIAACGRTPSPEQERYVRKVVSEMGCFGHVIWLLDNEGAGVHGANPAFYRWLQGIIRDEEQKSGCGFVHMTGTNSGIYEVEAEVADYIVSHERQALTGPKYGKFTTNNERNPSASPEEEAARFKGARDAGQAYFYWRAGQTDAEMVQTLGLFRDVVAGSVDPGCFAPDPEDSRWAPFTGAVNPQQPLAWLAAAKAVVGDPTALPGSTVFERGLLALDKLGAAIRAAGHCSSGRWKDALAVQGPDGHWYELHAIGFTDGGWAGEPFRQRNVWSYQ